MDEMFSTCQSAGEILLRKTQSGVYASYRENSAELNVVPRRRFVVLKAVAELDDFEHDVVDKARYDLMLLLICSEFSTYHVQVVLYCCTVDTISDRDQCNTVKAIKKDRFGFSAHTSKMVTIGNHNSQATSCRTVSYHCDTGTKTRLGSSAWPSNRFSGTFRGCLWQVEVVNCC